MTGTDPRPRVLLAGSLPLASPWNGADKNMARAIVRLDTGSRYTLLTGPGEAWPDHVTPVAASRPGAVPGVREWLRGAAFIARNIRRHDVLHVVASQRRWNPVARLVVRGLSRLSGVPVVHTLPSPGDRGLSPGMTLGDVTVAFSRFTADRLRAAGVADVVTMFPPLEWLPVPAIGAVTAARARLGIDGPAVLCATHAHSGNGLDTLIAAMAALPPELAKAQLVVALRVRAGQSLEAEESKVRAAAASMGLAGRVVTAGRVEDMPALISACSVTALVPRSLSGKMDLPMVILESLALARPVLVTDRPPLNEAVLDGGLTAPYGDIPAVTAALARLLGDPAEAARLAAAGRKRLAGEAARSSVRDTLASVYARAAVRSSAGESGRA